MSAALGRSFVKVHGLRNHFVIVDARGARWRPARDEILRICDVQVGVGADQLIVIEDASSAGVDVFMRIYNSDGGEAEACGNAMRCVAWLLLEQQARDSVVIGTLAGALRCERAGALLVRAEMGRVHRDWRRIPLSEPCDTLHLPVRNGPLEDAVAVNVGNPHAVFFTDNLDGIDLRGLARPIQELPLFPEGVNVGVAERLGPSRLRLAVYERGAGLTMACGSGACAAAYAARARGLLGGNRVTVSLPGGDVDIEIRDDDVAVMTGPVAFSFRGEL